MVYNKLYWVKIPTLVNVYLDDDPCKYGYTNKLLLLSLSSLLHLKSYKMSP